MLKELLTKFLNSERGQSLVEYTLLLTLIGVIGMVMLTASGIKVTRLFAGAESGAHYAVAKLGQR